MPSQDDMQAVVAALRDNERFVVTSHEAPDGDALGSQDEQRRSLDGLQAAHGFLQTQVARELGTRRTPVLSFEYDPGIERGVRLTKLIDELAPDDPDAERG